MPEDLVASAARATAPVDLAIRPEAIELRAPDHVGSNGLGLPGVVTRSIYTGASTNYEVDLASGERLQVQAQDRPGTDRWHEGDHVQVVLAPETLYVVPVPD
jgi:ABC-type Fe3+/spermidine/putrescine transport system ATPase subunit